MMTKILVGVFVLFMMKTAMSDDTMLTLFAFNGEETAKQWQTVNDGVMVESPMVDSGSPKRKRWSSSVLCL